MNYSESFCRDAQERRILGGTFFCSRRDENRRDVRRIIPSIAYQLAEFNEIYKQQLLKAIKGWNGMITARPCEQWRRLIVSPLELMAPGAAPALIVIDGIDECSNRDGQHALWTCLSGPIPGSFKVLVTAVPDSHVSFGFTWHAPFYSVDLDSPRQSVDSDIHLYVQNRLQKLSPSQMQWPSTEDVSRVVKRSQGLFIYAAEACRQVEAAGSAVTHLSNLLVNMKDLPAGMERFFGRIFTSAIGSFSDENTALCRSILGMLALRKERNLSLSDLSALLGYDTAHVKGLLVGFRSILRVPQDDTEPIHLYHPSLTEFLTAPQVWRTRCDLDGCENIQCQDHPRIDFSRLYMPKEQRHRCIADKLLHYMIRHLSTDIGIARYTVGAGRIIEAQRSAPNGALEYACKHWADHLLLSGSNRREDVNQLALLVTSFLETKGGSWLGETVNNSRDSFHESLRDLQSADAWQRLHASAFAPEIQQPLRRLIQVGISKLEIVIHSRTSGSTGPEETVLQDVQPIVSPILHHDAHRVSPPHFSPTNPRVQMPVPSILGREMVSQSYDSHTLRHYRSWQEENSPRASSWRRSLLMRPSRSATFADQIT